MRVHPAVLLLLGAAVSATADAAIQTGQPISPGFDNGDGPAQGRLQSGHDDGEEERQPNVVDALEWIETYAGALARFKAHIPSDIDYIADVSKLAKDVPLVHRQVTYHYVASQMNEEDLLLKQFFEEHENAVVPAIKALIGTGEEVLQVIASKMQLDLMRWWELNGRQPEDVFKLLKIDDSFSKALTAKQTEREQLDFLKKDFNYMLYLAYVHHLKPPLHDPIPYKWDGGFMRD